MREQIKTSKNTSNHVWMIIWQYPDGHAPPTNGTTSASRRPPRMGTRWPIPLLSTGKPLRGATPTHHHHMMITRNRLTDNYHKLFGYTEHGLSPVHTSDADEPPTVGGTNFDAYEYRTGSYSGVCRRRFVAQGYSSRRRRYSSSLI